MKIAIWNSNNIKLFPINYFRWKGYFSANRLLGTFEEVVHSTAGRIMNFTFKIHQNWIADNYIWIGLGRNFDYGNNNHNWHVCNALKVIGFLNGCYIHASVHALIEAKSNQTIMLCMSETFQKFGCYVTRHVCWIGHLNQ